MSELEIFDVEKTMMYKLGVPAGSRKVLVRITNKITDQKTPSGIIKIAATDTDWNKARHTDRMGVVMAVPKDPLPFKVKGDLMPWETHVQLGIGMTVWFDFMNTDMFKDENDDVYKLVDYDSCYVAAFPRVGDENLKWAQQSKDGTQWIVPLNGFHLFERIYKKQRGRFDVFETHKIDRSRGLVKYVANNNKQYETPGQSDHVDLKVGDEVKFGTVPEVMLEDEDYCEFDGGTMYRRAQARNIEMVWRDGALILPTGRCIVKQIPDETVTDAGVILLKKHVKNHRGEVLLSSMDGVYTGDVVKYIQNGGTPTKYNDEDARILKEDHVLLVEEKVSE